MNVLIMDRYSVDSNESPTFNRLAVVFVLWFWRRNHTLKIKTVLFEFFIFEWKCKSWLRIARLLSSFVRRKEKQSENIKSNYKSLDWLLWLLFYPTRHPNTWVSTCKYIFNWNICLWFLPPATRAIFCCVFLTFTYIYNWAMNSERWWWLNLCRAKGTLPLLVLTTTFTCSIVVCCSLYSFFVF